jgi:hypothetical protein
MTLLLLHQLYKSALDSKRQSIFLFYALILLALMTTGCGKREQKVQTITTNSKKTSGSQTASGSDWTNINDPSCSAASSCNKVEFKLSSNGSAAPSTSSSSDSSTGTSTTNASDPSSLSATVGDAVEWNFALETTAVAGRLLIASSQIPPWAKFETDTAGVKISGKPNQYTAAGQLIFKVRDMVRCKVSEKDIAICKDLKTDTKYDESVSFNYSILNPGGSSSSNQTSSSSDQQSSTQVSSSNTSSNTSSTNCSSNYGKGSIVTTVINGVTNRCQ